MITLAYLSKVIDFQGDTLSGNNYWKVNGYITHSRSQSKTISDSRDCYERFYTTVLP